MNRTILNAAAALAILLATAPVAAAQDDVVALHQAHIKLYPESHRITVEGSVIIPATVDSFYLHKSFHLQPYLESGAALPESTDHGDSDQNYASYYFPRWLFAQESSYGQLKYFYQYEGEFFESTADVTFSRENVGREIQATISDEGIYLSSSAYWLPVVQNALAAYQLTIETPEGIEPITQGKKVHQALENGRLVTTWSATRPSDGINLIAGPYHIAEDKIGETTIYTYLLQGDDRLSDLYLERTKAYIAMYEQMIGPYPYSKFATVENWFPTGYGMPSYTLLGSVVLRLPFIPYTSFGHEICHNWWGNSVFVGDGGNWCEGLTVYCADYHYKELESAEAAREYRRNLLKDYAAYVRDERDLPLQEFESRHSGATRAIGYGKSMMVFHLIDRLIGRDKFEQALRRIYSHHCFQQVRWSDFIEAFAEVGERDLSHIHPEWIARVGAPRLRLDAAERLKEGVRLTLSQDAPAYDLQVPVVVMTDSGPVERIVHLDAESKAFEIEAPGAVSAEVDPDYHLFRHLDPREIEPTLRQVLADPEPSFVLPAGPTAMTAAAREFAASFAEGGEPHLVESGAPPVAPARQSHSSILINPDDDLLARRLPAGATVTGGFVFLEGKRYSLDEYDLVLTAFNPGDPSRTDMIVLSRSAERLPALGRRIGHYGKYSWLLLPAGRGETVKGNWKPPTSPLLAEFD